MVNNISYINPCFNILWNIICQQSSFRSLLTQYFLCSMCQKFKNHINLISFAVIVANIFPSCQKYTGRHKVFARLKGSLYSAFCPSQNIRCRRFCPVNGARGSGIYMSIESCYQRTVQWKGNVVERCHRFHKRQKAISIYLKTKNID